VAILKGVPNDETECVVYRYGLYMCSSYSRFFSACNTADKDIKPARASFVPSPEFSPPYPPLPHNFGKTYGIQILCQAPKGAIKRALPRPLEQSNDEDLFVLLMVGAGL